MRVHEYVHVVSFEDTSLFGTVYFAHHLRWQGQCRESFLREHAPDVLGLFEAGLRLVTVRCSCEYLAELHVFDEVAIRLSLGGIVQNRIRLCFEYCRGREAGSEVVARGEQEIACMWLVGDRLEAVPVPATLRDALQSFE